MQDRIIWIDYAKAFAIFLVCLGHVHYQFPEIKFIIYSFHMPLFFLLSGMFSGSDFKIVKRLKGLIVPYFFFNIFNHLLRFALGKGPQMDDWIVNFVCFDRKAGLWFLPCLFSAQILLTIVLVIFKKNVKLGCLTLLLFSLMGVLYNLEIRKSLPFSLDISLIILPFMFFGYIIKNNESFLNKKFLGVGSFLLYVISMIGIILLPSHLTYQHIDLFRGVIGNPFLFYIAATSGCFFVINFFHKKTFNSKLLSYIGQNTLIIYCLHKLFLFLLNYVFSILLIDNLFVCLIMSIIEVIVIILLLVPVSKFINKYIPFVIGKY